MEKQLNTGCQGKAALERGKIIPIYKVVRSLDEVSSSQHPAPEFIFFNKAVAKLVTAQKKKGTASATKMF